MNSQNKPIIILIVVLMALFLCCCLCVLAGGAALISRAINNPNGSLQLPQLPTLPGNAPTATPSTQSQDLTIDLSQIENEVSSLRGLTLGTPLKRESLTTAQLEQQVTTEFFKDYTPEEATQDATTFALLGLLPKDFDLISFYKQLYAEQIAGYYDNKTKSMYVVADKGFGGMERATYAHEFTHALQDSNYNFETNLGYSDAACKQNSEYCAAIQALIEGDATNIQLSWINQYATKQDMQDFQSFYATYKSPVLDSAPAYMQDDMNFPYTQGSNFVKAIIGSGGDAALTAAFTTQKPVSTEQIMHPSRYPLDKPFKVTLPEFATDLGGSWKEIDRETIGEWYTWLILARGKDENYRQLDSLVSAATEGWGGDQYTVLTDGKNSVFVVTYKWDTQKDNEEAYKAFLTYTQLRFGKQDASDIACQGGYCSSLLKNTDQGFSWVVSTSRDAISVLQNSVQN